MIGVRRDGLKLPSIQREIAVGGIAGSKGTSRRTNWQTGGLASPPEPPLATRAEGLGQRAIGIEHFDAGARLWINIVRNRHSGHDHGPQGIPVGP